MTADVCEWLLKAKKLMEHRRRVERKREEKELTAKKERVKKAKEAAQKARKVMKCHELRLIVLHCSISFCVSCSDSTLYSYTC